MMHLGIVALGNKVELAAEVRPQGPTTKEPPWAAKRIWLFFWAEPQR